MLWKISGMDLLSDDCDCWLQLSWCDWPDVCIFDKRKTPHERSFVQRRKVINYCAAPVSAAGVGCTTSSVGCGCSTGGGVCASFPETTAGSCLSIISAFLSLFRPHLSNMHHDFPRHHLSCIHQWNHPIPNLTHQKNTAQSTTTASTILASEDRNDFPLQQEVCLQQQPWQDASVFWLVI